jgi:hypothetical protein
MDLVESVRPPSSNKNPVNLTIDINMLYIKKNVNNTIDYLCFYLCLEVIFHNAIITNINTNINNNHDGDEESAADVFDEIIPTVDPDNVDVGAPILVPIDEPVTLTISLYADRRLRYPPPDVNDDMSY